MSKELLAEMRANGYCEYGVEFTGEWVREVCRIKYPTPQELHKMSVQHARSAFNAVALAELTATDYCRNVLLGEGKYLSSSNGDYRILLPNETMKQVELYIQSADKKLRRALKLSRNSPPVPGAPPSQAAALIQAKLNSRRKY